METPAPWVLDGRMAYSRGRRCRHGLAPTEESLFPMRIGLICNPTAGSGKAARSAERAAREFERLGFAVEAVSTTARFEATAQAARLARVTDALVVGGGDGTITRWSTGSRESRFARHHPLRLRERALLELVFPARGEGPARWVARRDGKRSLDVGVVNGPTHPHGEWIDARR